MYLMIIRRQDIQYFLYDRWLDWHRAAAEMGGHARQAQRIPPRDQLRSSKDEGKSGVYERDEGGTCGSDTSQ
jgi:hypothetical protein